MASYPLPAGLDTGIFCVGNTDKVGEGIDADFARFAAELGATHVSVGGFPFEYDAFLPDNSDPYPNWSQRSVGLFRLCPPPVLAPFMPEATIARNRGVFDRRMAVLREHGLKAVLSMLEPMWLPEELFRAHPQWRGAQCELGRIANKPYFTPDIDHPEVLELYRQAARELIERYPEVEIVSLFTNDSGAGLQWSSYQYPGINGPTRTRHRGPGRRVADWLGAIREGARAAGGDLHLNLHSFTFPPHETEAIRSRLGERFYLKGINGRGESLWSSSASPGAMLQGLLPDMPAAAGYVRRLQAVYGASGGPRRQVSVGGPLSRALLEAVLADPGTGVVAEAAALRRAAAKLAGDDRADDLVRVWESLDRARHAASQVRQRGGVSPLTGTLMARWLVRPLVPQPELLTDEETAPFRRFIFSKESDKRIDDLCNVLGKQVFTGSCAVWMARGALQEAVATLHAAQAQTADLAGQASSANRPGLELFAARLGALACIYEDARLAIMYQHALMIADQPRFGANAWDFDDNVMFDQRALEMRRLARESLDNTTELIGLLESQAEPVLGVAADAATESVFHFGPDLVEQLRHKMNVMLDHWHEYEDLYPTSRPQEYEPDLLAREEPFAWEE